MSEEIVRLEGVSKIYQTGDTSITALDKTSISFYSNRLTLIMGPSGSGKTTLLSILGCIIYPSTGRVFFKNNEVTNWDENKLAELRLREIGFVFQQFNLIEPLNALENVMQPLLLQGLKNSPAKEKSIQALNDVGLGNRMSNLPKRLSGGQKQRVAIARALVSEPSMILCDEPTASLDSKSAKTIMTELKQLSKAGKAVIIVTHDLRLREFADHIIYVEEGLVSTAIKNEENYK